MTSRVDPSVLRATAWSTPDRYLESSILPGWPAIVAVVRGGEATLVIGSLDGVMSKTVPIDQVMAHLVPRLGQDPLESAAVLRSMTRTYFRALDGIVGALIQSFTDHPPEMPMPKAAKPSTAQKKLSGTQGVYADFQRRTCIAWVRSGIVQYIPLEPEGLDVFTTSEETFLQRYSLMEEYPVEQAARLYAGYAEHVGATAEAMELIGQLTTVTSKEIEMAAAKKEANTTKKPAVKAKPAPVAKEKKTAAAPKEKKTAAAPKEKTPRAPKAEGVESAAGMFRRLIMEGKKTDDEIFAEVQKVHGLDDSKRSYVAWYRNDLNKKGQNPPPPNEPKGGKK